MTYPLVPVLNLTTVSDNELTEIVGEKLAKSFDNAVSVDKTGDVSSIFDSLAWPMRNGSSIIRGAAMFEYLKRKSKVWKNRFVPVQNETSFYAQLTLSLIDFVMIKSQFGRKIWFQVRKRSYFRLFRVTSFGSQVRLNPQQDI